MHLISDGGPFFMVPLLISLIIIVGLFFMSLLGKGKSKMAETIKQIGTVALAWGLIGSIIGAIGAFDAIEASGGAAPALVAGGLKVTLLSSLLGLVVFFVSRLSALILSIRA